MENTRKITTTAMLVALAAVFSLMIYILPFLQSFIFITMIPLVIVGIKYDLKTQLLALLALALLLMMIDPFYAVMIGVWMGLYGLSQSYVIKNKKTTSSLILYSTLAFVFGLVAIVYLMNLLMNINLMNELTVMIDQTLIEIKEIYTNMNMLPEEDLVQYFNTMDQVAKYLPMLIPIMLLTYGFASSVLTMVITKGIFKRLKLPYPKDKFKDFRIDATRRSYLLAVMIVVTLASLLDKNHMEFYVINFTTILIYIMQINGFAFVWYRTETHPNRKALRIMSVIAYIFAPMFILLELIFRYGLALIGFMDMYVNFRERLSRKDNS